MHQNGGDFRAIKPLQIASENAGNCISEAIKLKIFWGACPWTPLGATAFGGRLPKPPFVKSWIRPSSCRLSWHYTFYVSHNIMAISLLSGLKFMRLLLTFMAFMICLKIMIVYHYLHGQARWSMVWANGMQTSGLVNFILESHSPFVQITSIYQKMTVKTWNWYQSWLWRNGTNFVLEYFIHKKGNTFSDVLLLPKFSTGMTQKVVFNVLSIQIFRKLFVTVSNQYFYGLL